jgi:putative Mn2+ efflux pump MntP
MIEVFILAVALSMDAFAVAIGLGAKHKKTAASLALMSGIYFGVFQALMPFIGYIGGKSIMGLIAAYAHWIAFILLLIIGAKMIYESFAKKIEQDITAITHKVMLMLAIATSIDAMAAGFTLTLFDVSPLIACLMIGVTTFCSSWLGVFIGTKSDTWMESKAELLGGLTLIAIGFKILLF